MALQAAYQSGVETYTAAVVELVTQSEDARQLNEKKFRLIAELADRASSNAKGRLDRHVREHG